MTRPNQLLVENVRLSSPGVVAWDEVYADGSIRRDQRAYNILTPCYGREVLMYVAMKEAQDHQGTSLN